MSGGGCKMQTANAVTPRITHPSRSRQRRGGPFRRGATLIETALVLMLFLMLLFGMLDLGLLVFRHQMLSFAARRGAREAIDHGEYADRLGIWGPAPISGTLDSLGAAIRDKFEPHLVGMAPQDIDVQITWLDGTNNFKKRIQVTLTTDYTPITTFIFGSPSFDVSASSTMPIAH